MVSIENLMTVQTIPDEYTPERRSSDPAEAVTKEAYAHAYKQMKEQINLQQALLKV